MSPSPQNLETEVSRARRYPAAAASLIGLGILLLLAPKLVGPLFGTHWFGLPAGLIFVGLSWVALILLSWLSQHWLAPLIIVHKKWASTDEKSGDHDA